MGFTRVQLYPLVLHRLGFPDDDARVSTTEVYLSINNALRKIARDFDWNWLITSETFTLSEGTNTHTPPDAWNRTLWIASEAFGYEINNTQRRAMLRYSASNGVPRYFSTEGGLITFAPTTTSDIVLVHQYLQNENQLNNDSDTTLCPDSMIDIVVLYAALEEIVKLKDMVAQSFLKGELDEQKKSAQQSNRQARGNMSIRSRNGWRLGSGTGWPTGGGWW